jgi:hypothetical protein
MSGGRLGRRGLSIPPPHLTLGGTGPGGYRQIFDGPRATLKWRQASGNPIAALEMRMSISAARRDRRPRCSIMLLGALALETALLGGTYYRYQTLAKQIPYAPHGGLSSIAPSPCTPERTAFPWRPLCKGGSPSWPGPRTESV